LYFAIAFYLDKQLRSSYIEPTPGQVIVRKLSIKPDILEKFDTSAENEGRRAMKGRREFLKGSLAVAGMAVTGGAVRVEAASRFPVGLIYTKEAPGRWAGKEGIHAPKITVEGGKIKLVTSHPMSEKHYIVKHTLLTPEGKIIGEKTFSNTDPVAESSYKLPEGFKGALWAASFCNLHDLWVTELTI
jgi:superoxide reductase